MGPTDNSSVTRNGDSFDPVSPVSGDQPSNHDESSGTGEPHPNKIPANRAIFSLKAHAPHQALDPEKQCAHSVTNCLHIFLTF